MTERLTRAALAVATFVLTFAIRVHGISTHFWLMGDQIRDWRIALRPFHELPLVGPATHVGGYTVGPAFYWILWLFRVTLGPFFENLPHAGGIGQSALSSGADALLLVALWRKTGSVWTALAVTILVATGGFDLSLAAVLWNPMVGSILAKIATALILLDWHRASLARRVTVTAVAWAAVHAYTAAIYVAVGVFGALLLEPAVRRDWPGVRRNAVLIAAVVGLLQVPYLLHQVSVGFGEQAMGAVTGGLTQVLTGRAAPQVTKSVVGYLGAVNYIQGRPWTIPALGLLLTVCSMLVAVRYRRDVGVLSVTLTPALMTLVGFALFLDDLDYYYYFSIIPSAVLIVVLGLTAWPWRAAANAMAIGLTVVALAVVPRRMDFAARDNRLPQYAAIVAGARTIAHRGLPMRAVRTDFTLPFTVEPMFIYEILGGRTDAASRWAAIIAPDGSVTYQDLGS